MISEKKKISRWGNSAGVVLSRAVLAAAGLDLDEEIVVRAEGGKIIIESARRKLNIRTYSLDELLEGVEPVGEWDIGMPRGAEILDPYEGDIKEDFE